MRCSKRLSFIAVFNFPWAYFLYRKFIGAILLNLLKDFKKKNLSLIHTLSTFSDKLIIYMVQLIKMTIILRIAMGKGKLM